MPGIHSGQKGIGSPGTGMMDVYKLTCQCWESSLGLLHEQVFLTTDPFPSPPHGVL